MNYQKKDKKQRITSIKLMNISHIYKRNRAEGLI